MPLVCLPLSYAAQVGPAAPGVSLDRRTSSIGALAFPLGDVLNAEGATDRIAEPAWSIKLRANEVTDREEAGLKTLGIDLSADPKKTAACSISWEDGRAIASLPERGLSDQQLLERIEEADWTGIDAPFGWPDEFIKTIMAWAEEGRWSPVERKQLRDRETDRFVEGIARMPLSVSSDRIAVTAMRCAAILDALAERRGHPINRLGADQVVEVYPAAALVLWSDEAQEIRFDANGYKGSTGREKREVLVADLDATCPWLNLEQIGETCIGSDDAFDALISALVARAAAHKKTTAPQSKWVERAEREGWIHLPHAGSLDKLPTS